MQLNCRILVIIRHEHTQPMVNVGIRGKVTIGTNAITILHDEDDIIEWAGQAQPQRFFDPPKRCLAECGLSTLRQTYVDMDIDYSRRGQTSGVHLTLIVVRNCEFAKGAGIKAAFHCHGIPVCAKELIGDVFCISTDRPSFTINDADNENLLFALVRDKFPVALILLVAAIVANDINRPRRKRNHLYIRRTPITIINGSHCLHIHFHSRLRTNNCTAIQHGS
mmetsp:Transcript_18758/g.39470  ORF Transcript_18758/g.39470 Transcript_18758/m.39470 type:complete len:222 (-) Transcript_18758:364-1029(-)